MKYMALEEFTEIFNKYAKKCPFMREDDTLYIYGSVEMGGSSGGDCWGGSSSAYRTGLEESNAEVPELDSILEEISPDISFLKYKILINTIPWNTDTRYENEYYGNYTKYGYKYIDCNSLFNALKTAEII